MHPQFALAIITDTHVAKAIAIQLRNNGLDVVRLEEIVDLPNDASDIQILQWATDNERAVLSLDDDFATLHYEWIGQGHTHNGIFWGRSRLQGQGGIGLIVTFISDYATAIGDMSDMQNQLIEME
mgnify:CR=1 FL=1